MASVAERGYAASTVADLVALSGVSRGDFYKHFANKEECFLGDAGGDPRALGGCRRGAL